MSRYEDEESFYRRFCGDITEHVMESKLNAVLFGGSTNYIWLLKHLDDPAFYKTCRIMFCKYTQKPFRRLTFDDLPVLKTFLDTVDKYEFLHVLKYGKVEEVDLRQLEESVQEMELLENVYQSDVATTIKREVGKLFVDQDFEHEPAHLYLKSQFKTQPSEQNFDEIPSECFARPLVLDNIVKIQAVKNCLDMPPSKKISLRHTALKESELLILHPDKIAVREANAMCQLGIPLDWVTMPDIYDDQRVLLSENVSDMTRASFTALVLPDRQHFVQRCVGRYVVAEFRANDWYEDIMKIVMANFDPNKMVIELTNRPLAKSTLWNLGVRKVRDNLKALECRMSASAKVELFGERDRLLTTGYGRSNEKTAGNDRSNNSNPPVTGGSDCPGPEIT